MLKKIFLINLVLISKFILCNDKAKDYGIYTGFNEIMYGDYYILPKKAAPISALPVFTPIRKEFIIRLAKENPRGKFNIAIQDATDYENGIIPIIDYPESVFILQQIGYNINRKRY